MTKKDVGYIYLHRKLRNHWIWSDSVRLKWWLDVLFSANYLDGTKLIKGNLIECKRGQCIKSLETWAKEWLTTKKTVRNFFILLQKDKMILVENIKVSTRITVCNYDSYNNNGNGNDHAEETEATTQGKRSLPPSNKGNKGNKDNKENIEGSDFDFFNQWIQENAPAVGKMKEPFTEDQYHRLLADFTDDFIMDLLSAMHNHRELPKKVSANLTFRKWAKTHKFIPAEQKTANNKKSNNSFI